MPAAKISRDVIALVHGRGKERCLLNGKGQGEENFFPPFFIAKETYAFPSCFLAASTTASVVKPKCFSRSFSGEEAPKVCIPIMAPVVPT